MVIELSGASKLFGYITGAGTSRNARELASPANSNAMPKVLFPVGSRRVIDFPLDSIDRLPVANLGGVYINYRKETERVIDYLKSVETFYGRSALRPLLETSLLGSAGSLKTLNDWVHINPDDVIVMMAGDCVQNMDVESVLQAHLENKADATLVVRPIWENEKEKLANCDTVTLSGMPSMSEKEFEPKMKEFLHLMANHGRVMQTDKYNRRALWQSAQSNLADASIYILSGKFVLEYIIPQLTPRPAGKQEAKTLVDIETLERALRVVRGRGQALKDKQTEINGLLNAAVQKLTEESEGEFAFHFYNMEHVLYRATRKIFHNVENEPEMRTDLKIQTYLMPEEVFWRDVGDVHSVWQTNMDAINKKNIHLLRLEEGAAKGLWRQTQWGWVSTRNVRIHSNANIRETSIICDDCSIEEDVEIVNSIIQPGAIIHRGAKVFNSVVFPKAVGGRDNEIGNNVTLNSCMFLGGVLNEPGTYEWETFYVPKGNIIRNSFRKG